MFDTRRFALLSRAHFSEHARSYAWFLSAGFLIEIVVSILFFAGSQGYNAFNTKGQESLFYFGLFVLPVIFAGRYFQSMSSRAPALLALMRPASVFEKWLLAVLVIVVMYPLAYALFFYVVMIPDWLLASAMAQDSYAHAALEFAKHPKGAKPTAPDPDEWRLFLPWLQFKSWREATQIGLWLLSLQGFAVFGSLYFRSVPFIKSLLAALLFVLVIAMCSEFVGGSPDLVLNYWDSRRPMSSAQVWGYAAVWFAFPAMLWLACYLGLREREIAA